MICPYVSRGDLYNNYDVTSARNIFQSSGHSKIVSNISQTHPKYLISIGIIIWNEKRDFRTLSRGDNNHWCVGKENNRLENNIWHPLLAALMRHMLYKGWISNLLLFYSSSTSEIKSSSSSITAAWIWHSEEKFSEKNIRYFKESLHARVTSAKSHQHHLNSNQSAILFLVWQSKI